MGKKAAAARSAPAEQQNLHLASDSVPLKDVPSFTEGGKGRRLCEECEKEGKKDKFTGARTLVCKHGHQKQEKPGAGSASGSKRSSAPGVDTEKLAMEFVLFENAGNIDKAAKAVESYKEDSLAAFIAACGGADKASAVLKKMLEKKAGA